MRAKFFSIVVLFVLLVSVPLVGAQEEETLPVAGWYRVNAETLNARVLPGADALKAEVGPFGAGAVIQVTSFQLVGDDIWGSIPGAFVAYRVNGTTFMVPATPEEIQQTQAELQGGGGPTLVLNQTPLYEGDKVIGYAVTPQESPAQILVPEGGSLLFAYDNAGFWTVVEEVGTPDDGNPSTDLNTLFEASFTNGSLAVVLFDEVGFDVGTALAAELFDLGAVGVIVDNDDPVEDETYDAVPATTYDFALVGSENVGAGGQFNNLIVPEGAAVEDDLFVYVQTEDEPFNMPLQGHFSIFSAGNAFVEIGGSSWLLETDGTVGNTVIIEVATDYEGLPVARFSEFVPGAHAFITVYAGEETPAQGLASNGKNNFNPPNCGADGCATSRTYYFYVTNAGVFSAAKEFTSESQITDQVMQQMIDSVKSQAGSAMPTATPEG